MSNPIADTAEYFSEKRNNPKPNLRIFPSQDPQSSPHDLLSPESPESRRRPHIPSHNLSDFDPKLQWKKVLKRLPNRHDILEEWDAKEESSDEGQPAEEDSYRMRHRHRQQSQNPYYNDKDDMLPDADDLHQHEGTDQSDIMLPPEPLPLPHPEQSKPDNYFVNPFQSSGTDTTSDDVSKTTEEMPGTPALEHEPAPSKKYKNKKKQAKAGTDHEHMVSSSTSESSSSSSDNDSERTPSALHGPKSTITMATTITDGTGRAKKHWGKTLDKVRLIANLHTLPRQPKTSVSSSSSLVPYYPPLFDPVFIALSKDQHGRPWVCYAQLLLQISLYLIKYIYICMCVVLL